MDFLCRIYVCCFLGLGIFAGQAQSLRQQKSIVAKTGAHSVSGSTLKSTFILGQSTVGTSSGSSLIIRYGFYPVLFNQDPTDFSMDDQEVDENVLPPGVVGVFSTDDPEINDTHVYTLVSGEGDTDNGLFSIVGNQLQTNQPFDFEGENENTYNIRIETDDEDGGRLQKEFTIIINNTNDQPTDLSIDVSAIDENLVVGTLVGTLSTKDQDIMSASDMHGYSLAIGGDNGFFSISGNQLLTTQSFDFETTESYTITVTTTDTGGSLGGGGLQFEKEMVISVNDVNDPPEAIEFATQPAFNENLPIGTSMGTFTTTDEDEVDTHTYTLVSGDGDSDNVFFEIVGNEILTTDILNYERVEGSTFSFRVQTSDQESEVKSEMFNVTVLNIDDAPSGLQQVEFSISEGESDIGVLIPIDDDGETNTSGNYNWTILDQDGGNFFIDQAGAPILKSVDALNFSTQTLFNLSLRVSDILDLDNSTSRANNVLFTDIAVTINVISTSGPILDASEIVITDLTSCLPLDGALSAESANLISDISPPSGGYTYEWWNGNTVLGNANFTGVTVNNLNSGEYTLQVTNNDNGLSSLPVTISIDDLTGIPFTGTVGNNTSCTTEPNGVIDILVSGGFTNISIDWFVGSDTSSPFVGGTDGIISGAVGERVAGLSTGKYTVMVSNTATGCSEELTYDIQDQMISPVINTEGIIIQNVTSCLVDNGSFTIDDPGLTASTSSGEPDLGYTFDWWQGPNSSGLPSFSGLNYSNLVEGDYVLIVTNNDTGCQSSLSQLEVIDQAQPPLITTEFLFNNTSIDAEAGNGSISVSNDGELVGNQFEWFTGIDTTTPFEEEDGAVTGASGETITGLTEGNYTVRITNLGTGCVSTEVFQITDNSVGNQASIDGNIVFENEIKPAESNKQISISPVGGIGQYTIRLNYKAVLAEEYKEENFSASQGESLVITIAENEFDVFGLIFDVVISDGDNIFSSVDNLIFRSFDELEAPRISTIERFGGTLESWNLFSIPYELENNSISAIFTDLDPARHEFDWRIMRYRSNSNDYVNFNTGQTRVGEAYWFNAKEPVTINTGAGQVTTEIPFSLILSQGWNLIGNPYNIAISWNQVLEDNGSPAEVGQLQVFSGTTQSAGNVMQPFTGGFVFADAATSVTIDPRTAAGGRRLNKPVEKITSHDLGEAEWVLNLNLVSEGYKERVGGFGMHPAARNLKDEYDQMAVPRFVAYSDLYTVHEEYFYPYFSTDIVPTNQSHSWEFTLASNKTEGISAITWDHKVLGENKAQLILIDKQTGQLVDMKATGSYTVDLNDKEFEFEILYSADANTPIGPQSAILGNAYPNPAKTSTFIPLAVPASDKDVEIRLSIFDINGKQVKLLRNSPIAPGFHQIEWDLTNDQFSTVGRGLYIYRVEIEGQVLQKKLIVE